eukprot:TRINITY_DN3195_c0_g1_i1.p1 TRINITY_DN3195_c0_g1~~TRINITY_DN3195_c0_g1_i1.p1  ORF type:complete len:358 (+),score=146.12 TRINITY_DN3195_c0_g1_i1:399-1472(+)
MGGKNLSEKTQEQVTELLKSINGNAEKAFESIVAWQQANVDRVEGMVKLFLPQDFRAKMLAKKRASGEAKKKAEIEEIMNNGGTIADKYNKMWEQQLDRRGQLVQLGNASGMFKFLIKFAGGVPQVLLDFVKTINDDVGPLEETRLTYGPNVYKFTEFSNKMHIAMRYLTDLADKLQFDEEDSTGQTDIKFVDTLQTLDEFCGLYAQEMAEYLDFMSDIFEQSPFFISAEQAAQYKMESEPDSYIEATVDARSIYEHRVQINGGNTVGYEFKTAKNDIAFELVFVKETEGDDDEEGEEEEVTIIENKRYNAQEDHITGDFEAQETGTYIFLFDNSFSYFTKKELNYRIFIKKMKKKI